MAKQKATGQGKLPGVVTTVRRADAQAPGGGAALGVDPEAACDSAIALIVEDIARLGLAKQVRGNDVNRGTLLATYARTLSAISRDRLRVRGGKEDLGAKSMEELVEMARGIPELRELLEAGR